MKTKDYIRLIISIIISELAGVVGVLFAKPAISEWYTALNKPALNPPSWVFGPVWLALYALMGVSLYLVWANNWKVANPVFSGPRKTWNPWSERLWLGDWQKWNVVAIFALQLFLNALWTLIFFGLKFPGAAFFEILMLWFAILYTIVNFYRISKIAAYLLIPYIIWVSFAAYLNYSVWQLNFGGIIAGQVVCTQEAKQCSDGSFVGRTEPNCEFAACPVPNSEQSSESSDRTVVSFRHPKRLSTEYISVVAWPPKVQVLNVSFACTEAGEESVPAGRTERHAIDGREYCVTKETQGAAGSMYTMYAYAFPNDNKTIIFTFSLHFSQCGNYNEPQRTSCESEHASFDIDDIVDKMAQSVTFTENKQ